ncbi:MAG TPA: hypothetical protein VGH11_10120 [Jatrophihabitans sp.]|jgi:anti-sigma factor RsiW
MWVILLVKGFMGSASRPVWQGRVGQEDDMAGDPFITFDAYVLGALEDGDRRAYEADLRVCGRCRAAVEELAGMPRLLAAAPDMAASADRAIAEPGSARSGTARRRAVLLAGAAVVAA